MTQYIVTKAATRWDALSYIWYGTFDRINDIKNANLHVTLATKLLAYIPIGTKVFKPDDAPENTSTIGAASWRP